MCTCAYMYTYMYMYVLQVICKVEQINWPIRVVCVFHDFTANSNYGQKNNTRTWPSSVSLTQDMWLVQVQYYMNTCAFTDAHITFNIFQENFQTKDLKVLASKTCSEQGTSLFHRIIIHLNTISLTCMYVYLYIPQRRSSSADRTACSVIGTTCSCHSEAFPMSCSRYHDNKQSQKPIL